jgi:uncharacterized membrane protein
MQNTNATGRVISGLAAAGLAAYAVKGTSNPTGRVVSAIASALLGAHAATGFSPANAATQLATRKDDHSELDRMAIRVERSTTINAPVQKVYEFWNDVENFPKFMTHLQTVTRTGARRSHWVADAPLGASVEWDAEEIKNVPNDVIAWQSVSGNVPNAGSVRFRAMGPRTRVTVKLGYTPPAGSVGAAVAKFFGEDPKTQLKEYLTKLKGILEEGVDPVSVGRLGAAEAAGGQ